MLCSKQYSSKKSSKEENTSRSNKRQRMSCASSDYSNNTRLTDTDNNTDTDSDCIKIVEGNVEENVLRGRYDAFLKLRGVWCDDSVITTRENVVAGFGCVATENIQEGAVLFRIPRCACFGASEEDDDTDEDVAKVDGTGDKTEDEHEDEDKDETTKDTHKKLALKIIEEKRLGSKSEWKPFLDIVTPSLTPVIWPLEAAALLLKDTELGPVMKQKIDRLNDEMREENIGSESQSEYLDAVALASSHSNPWFGVCIVPFNTTLNWGENPNVEFDLVQEEETGESVVIGVSTRLIQKGEELLQTYGDSAAELLYRCGFLPQRANGEAVYLEGDCVSINLQRLVQECKLDQKAASKRARALCEADVLGNSSWDGVDEITVELTRPDLKDAEMNKDDGGVAKLVGAMLSLLVDGDSWEKAEKAVNEIDTDAEYAGDFKSANIISSLLGTPQEKVRAIAEEAGLSSYDPWPRLIEAASKTADVTTKSAISNAIDAAKRVVESKWADLDSCLNNALLQSADADGDDRTQQASVMSEGLKKVERELLRIAAKNLESLK